MSFDPTKPVQTRDGRATRILATDRKDTEYPIVALMDEGGRELLGTYTSDGHFYSGSTHSLSDLVNIPVETVTYRTARFEDERGFNVELGGMTLSTFDEAQRLALGDPYWDGVLKITRVDGKLTAVELVSE